MSQESNAARLIKIALLGLTTLVLANCGKAKNSAAAGTTNASATSTGYASPSLPSITNPTTVTPAPAPRADVFVNDVYKSMLKRNAAVAEIAYWQNAVAAGTCATLMNGVGQSEEFQGRVDAASDTAYVEQLYQGILGRAPDAGGWALFVNEITSYRASMSVREARLKVVPLIGGSDEAKARCTAAGL